MSAAVVREAVEATTVGARMQQGALVGLDGSHTLDPSLALVEVRNLEVSFASSSAGFGAKGPGLLKALDGVSLTIREGQVMGLVGESGSGKSTLGRAILRLNKPSGGEIRFRGTDITRGNRRDVGALLQQAAYVFQDPYSSLNPRMRLGPIIAEPLVVQGLRDKRAVAERVAKALHTVNLSTDYLRKYPHALSGGQRQRVAIARALVTQPAFLVADEPVSALDVSVQAQIINLLGALKEDLGLTMLFISHDLAVVQHISDVVAVMYLGRVVETAPSRIIFARPLHPYTRALLSAVPNPEPSKTEMPCDELLVFGEAPNPMAPPSGCSYRTRCPFAFARCAEARPPLVDLGAGHSVSCYLVQSPEEERNQ